jgi:hypothetical protein
MNMGVSFFTKIAFISKVQSVSIEQYTVHCWQSKAKPFGAIFLASVNRVKFVGIT